MILRNGYRDSNQSRFVGVKDLHRCKEYPEMVFENDKCILIFVQCIGAAVKKYHSGEP